MAYFSAALVFPQGFAVAAAADTSSAVTVAVTAAVLLLVLLMAAVTVAVAAFASTVHKPLPYGTYCHVTLSVILLDIL
jgi:hypothetical protein